MKTTAAAISSRPPSQSTLRLQWNTGILPILGSSSASDPSPSGTLIQKIIDQCRCSANTPPRIGPPTPAATQTPLKYASYRPPPRGGTNSEINVSTFVLIPPPPSPSRQPVP